MAETSDKCSYLLHFAPKRVRLLRIEDRHSQREILSLVRDIHSSEVIIEMSPELKVTAFRVKSEENALTLPLMFLFPVPFTIYEGDILCLAKRVPPSEPAMMNLAQGGLFKGMNISDMESVFSSAYIEVGSMSYIGSFFAELGIRPSSESRSIA